MKHTVIMPSKRKKNEARKAKKEGKRESEKLACEQALLFGQVKRAWGERARDTVKYMFLNFSTQQNSIGRRNRCWKTVL